MYDSIKRSGRQVKFRDFTDFLEKYMRINSNPMFRDDTSRGRVKTMRTHTEDEPLASGKGTRSMCTLHPEGSKHTIKDCSIFKSLTFSERKDHAAKHKLCFNCLDTSHQAKSCDVKNTLKCSECDRPHLTLMHDENFHKQQQEYRNQATMD